MGMLDRMIQKNVVHATPPEVSQQLVETRFYPVNIDVMAKPCFGTYAWNAGLLGINFPWVKVKNARLAVGCVDALKHPAGQGIRQQAKVSTTTGREVAPKCA
jgi:hypothetical protein